MDLVSVEGILPSNIEWIEASQGHSSILELGAGTTFQDILDSPAAPAVLKAAASGMMTRPVRNRATVGGNIGANKSCASLIPVFLVTGATYLPVVAQPGSATAIPAADWPVAGPTQLIGKVQLHVQPGRRYAYRRWSRTSCDLSVLTAAVAYDVDASGSLTHLQVALGGLAPTAKRFPGIEAALANAPLPSYDRIVELVAPFFHPISDARGSAEFKRYRASCLLAEALLSAQEEDIASLSAPSADNSARSARPATSPEVRS
jgi:putative selenate reductase FAD-binding subunit